MADNEQKVTFQEPGFHSAGMIFSLVSIILIVVLAMMYVNKSFRLFISMKVDGVATLSVTGGETGTGAILTLDTIPYGEVPMEEDIVVGKHILKVVKEGFKPYFLEFEAVPKSKVHIAVYAKPPLRKDTDDVLVVLLEPSKKTQATTIPSALPTATIAISISPTGSVQTPTTQATKEAL